MPVSNTASSSGSRGSSPARVVSINADGDDPSAADRVDAIWRDYRDDALSIIRTLREPDPAMAEAGDVEIWERMIEAALAEADAGSRLEPELRPDQPTARRAAGTSRARPTATSKPRIGRIRPLRAARAACRRR